MSQTPTKPSHRVYALQKGAEKSRWTEIGALWPHKDGKGFSMKLSNLPIDGSDISIRVIEPKQDDIPCDAEGGAQ